MFHMTNDSHLFRTASSSSTRKDFYPVRRQPLEAKGEEWYLPLYEGKMVQAFDHRAASVVVNPDEPALVRLNHDNSSPQTASGSLISSWLPEPRVLGVGFLNAVSATFQIKRLGWTLVIQGALPHPQMRGHSSLATMLPAVVIWAIQVPILKPQTTRALRKECDAGLPIGPIAMMLGFRDPGRRLQGHDPEPVHLWNSFPSSRPRTTTRQFRRARPPTTSSATTCSVSPTRPTTWSPSPGTSGYDGPPFTWDEEERRHLRARLDALYFHLYGLDREDAAYVLDTFPIVRRQDVGKFGSYRTRDLILAYMSALAAGDTETVVSV